MDVSGSRTQPMPMAHTILQAVRSFEGVSCRKSVQIHNADVEELEAALRIDISAAFDMVSSM